MIRIVGSHLYIGEYLAEDLAERFGTPLYVYDKEVIVENYLRLARSIPYEDLEILYSCKANNNPEILATLRDLGSGLDVVSPFEALLGIRLGFPREKILFTGTSVSDDEMKFVRGELGVMINIDSLSQLKRYGRLFPGTEVSVRINPGVGAGHHGYAVTGGVTKFGVYLNQIEKIRDIAREFGLRIVGLHMHIGSGILDANVYRETLDVLLSVARRFSGLEFIDIGGGLGIPYKPGEKPIDLDQFGSIVSKALRDFSQSHGHVKLRIEPGRYIVGNAGVLLVRVVDIKEVEINNSRKIFVGVDSGMNHLIRPALYGSYHEVIPASKADKPKEILVDIVGDICESGDILALERPMPRLEEGDLLAIMDVGAYGYSMSSNYNLRPRPPEIMVFRDEVKLVRRRETFDDLIRLVTNRSI
ncbi:diaminopimelate decarboxylase [Desulfurococcaceae archaeon AG1]|jgi:diaminopimelate decarboxylase|nr:MAG: diaminopimelate decarboxylase [Desulfurococcaceae archaeon]GAY25451.1 diaminopimelate decarboxylase [Desulfurococcaceae archaeon AG1]